MAAVAATGEPVTPFQSPTFDKDVKIAVNEEYTAASISPSGRDVVLAGTQGILIIDLDNPYSPPRYIRHRIGFEVADVQWSPFASRTEWIASTNNNKAIIFNLNIKPVLNEAPIQFTLDSHQGNITDINFSAHHPDVLATCALDTYVFTWDLRAPQHATNSLNSVQRTPSVSFADWQGGATQVKWNRQNEFILASSHDRRVQIWDIRHGAVPISTINAHFNKVYGIDWHRSEPTKILTCSLDKTIKQWDQVGITREINEPTRTIFTEYPLLRARHTPFPNGIVALPQYGSASLGLYRQTSTDPQTKTTNTPSHVFDNNSGATRLHEFLWRSRGDCDNGIDNREFQLVTWGTDHQLRLHSVDPLTLKHAIDFEKGGPALEKPTQSRLGAQYITFRDGPVAMNRPNRSQDGLAQTGTLSSLFKNPQQANVFSLAQGQPRRATMTARTVRRDPKQRVVSHVTWMHNVNIEKRKVGEDGKVVEQKDDKHHAIAQEIVAVCKKYPNLHDEHVEAPYREVVIAFKGPWGDINTSANQNHMEIRKPVFLRLTIGIPEKYPHVEEEVDEDGEVFDLKIHPLEITFEKTTAAIHPSMLEHLKESLQRITKVYAYQGRPALDAVFAYALGESSLEEIIAQAKDTEDPNVGPGPLRGPAPGGPQDEDISSEEEEDDDEDSDTGEFTNDLMNSSLSNANIPLPAQTVAKFSSPGFLVTARVLGNGPTFIKGSSSLLMDSIRLPRNLRQNLQKDDIFETFGRITAGHGSESPNSSTISWESSSSPSSSSGSDSETEARFRNFLPPLPWQKMSSRLNTKTSLPSTIDPPNLNKRSIITILDSPVAQFIPSKKALAEEYLIFGDGPSVCSHNADVAKKHGYEDLSDIWQLCALILSNKVPLDILPQTHRREQVLILARRALVRIKRKDSGLDLQFDEANAVTNPKLKSRVKWGHSPIVSYLIPALFDHFETLADTQMLAMLSCIFSEPAAREGVPSILAKKTHHEPYLPMSMEAPAFSLDYFSSAEAAWSLFKSNVSNSSTPGSTPAHSRRSTSTPVGEIGWYRLSKHLDTYGSHGSSNGPWGSDTIPSEPVTPYSTGNTPPPFSNYNPSNPTLSRTSTFTKAATAANTPYGTSPEQSLAGLGRKMGPGAFSTALAQFGKNLMSSSPTGKAGTARAEDLSTSAPSGGVTWGTTTFMGSGSQERVGEVGRYRERGGDRTKHGKRASFGQADRQPNVDYIPDSDDSDDDGPAPEGASDYTLPLNPKQHGAVATTGPDVDSVGSIKITLKNQYMFDDEACVSAPLLDGRKEWLYRAWREQYAEMLGGWGLSCRGAEVRKFNGLVGYYSTSDVTAGQPPMSRERDGSVHLALKAEGDQMDSTPKSQSTLAPPSHYSVAQMRRSQMISRNFSFNPEATEFTPGDPESNSSPFPPLEVSPAATGLYTPTTEASLRFNIPTPFSETSTDPFTPSQSLLKSSQLAVPPHHSNTTTPIPSPAPHRLSRPSLSRGASGISGHSAASTTRHQTPAPPSTTPATSPQKKGKGGTKTSETVYTCSICWIRVHGRVYWCPYCNHVAHFECMNLDNGPVMAFGREETAERDGPHDEAYAYYTQAETWECVVGCSCGCGFSSEDERSRIERFIEGVRGAVPTGAGWNQRGGGWLPEVEFDEDASTKRNMRVPRSEVPGSASTITATPTMNIPRNASGVSVFGRGAGAAPGAGGSETGSGSARGEGGSTRRKKKGGAGGGEKKKRKARLTGKSYF